MGKPKSLLAPKRKCGGGAVPLVSTGSGPHEFYIPVSTLQYINAIGIILSHFNNSSPQNLFINCSYRKGSVVANSIVTYPTTAFSSVVAVATAISSAKLQAIFQQILNTSTNGTCIVNGLTNTSTARCDKVTASMATKGASFSNY